MVLDWGYNVLVVDYRSFGKSGGELLGENQLYADAEQIYAFARALDYRNEEIILYCYSMGVAMVCHLASRKGAKAVIMESGYSSVDEMEFAKGLCPSYPLNNAEKAKHILIPALVIHGELDEVITVDHAERIWENLASDVKEINILTGGGHGDLKGMAGYAGFINGFIDRLG
ncbi:hypothetical protein GCM10022289_45060 [Pedobacter jeongneungensis]|uniref:Serine aminopeptidase S33 domain-containing protein n=1 Tax=Pedobacter jeongneungensis TaxID=947309 RepID=A0ABP8BQ17_9SPHI